MTKAINRIYALSVVLAGFSFVVVIFSAVFAIDIEVSKPYALLVLLASFLVSIVTNILLIKVGKIRVANLIAWCFGSLILAPISYFVLLYIQRSTILEFVEELHNKKIKPGAEKDKAPLILDVN